MNIMSNLKKTSVLINVKSFDYALGEMISFTVEEKFTRRRRISHCEAIFHPPARVDLVEKPTSRNLSVFLVHQKGLEPSRQGH